MCDASDYVVGAVLGHRVDKKLNVIHYASKTLDSVFACDKFRSYIVDSKVIVHTNHAPIKYLMEKKMLNLDLFDGFSCYKNSIYISLIKKDQRTP